jgi:hypothetical protein
MPSAETENGEANSLIIVHSDGRKECHPLIAAKWNHYPSSELGHGTTTLYFCVEASEGIANTDEYAASVRPWWEICIVEKTLKTDAISAGVHFDIPNAHDPSRGGYVTNFYYYEHESTVRNRVAIHAVDGNRLRATVEGHLEPKSQFWTADGVKSGVARVAATTWFLYDPMALRQTM